jgi:hypothetical protein
MMKFRALALGAVLAAATTGLIPATAMASGTPAMASGTPAMGTPAGASSGAAASSGASAGSGASSGAGASASASASDKNNINVSVITQLPREYYWDNKRIYDDGHEVALPAGDRYTDDGVLGADGRFYFAPSGKHDGVAIAPMRCQNGKYAYNSAGSGNWLGSIVDSALKACAGVYDAAYGIISDVVGNGSGYSGSSGGGC